MFRRAAVLVLIVGLASLAAPSRAQADESPSVADLMKAKAETARRAYEAAVEALAAGKADAERVYLWSRRLLEAEQDSSDKKADRLTALEEHHSRMKDLWKVTQERYKQGHAIFADVVATDYYVAEATLWLARAKTK
jgi:hypothetical protein